MLELHISAGTIVHLARLGAPNEVDMFNLKSEQYILHMGNKITFKISMHANKNLCGAHRFLFVWM